MRNWAPEEIRARGFDPVTGARVKSPTSRCDPGCCCPGVPPALVGAGDALSYARSYLKPEQLLQVQVIEQLRPKLVAGAKLISMCGELPGGTKLFQMWQAVRAAMGYEPGTPDMAALHAGRVCFIELKRPRGEADLLGHRKHAAS